MSEGTRVTRQSYKLHLQVNDSYVFYAMYSHPPGRWGCGGGINSIFPGGNLYELPYSRLVELGTGTHVVELGYDVQNKEQGVNPFHSDVDRAVHHIRLCRFGESVNYFRSSDTVDQFIHYATPENCDKLFKELDESQQDEVREYAKRIPITRADRDGMNPGYPDENLAAIRVSFGNG